MPADPFELAPAPGSVEARLERVEQSLERLEVFVAAVLEVIPMPFGVRIRRAISNREGKP